MPALDGVDEKLQRGARVADVGCGHGASTILMAQAFPSSTFVGFDYHDGVDRDRAQARAEEAGVADRVHFEVAPAEGYPGADYDLVTFFDCLHDMGDPVGAARHVRETLAPDGTWMIVEPFADDRLEDNLNPIGRVYYGARRCSARPASLSQEVGLALGAQAGEARLREVVTAGGFTRFRRAAETPFNLVLEARPLTSGAQRYLGGTRAHTEPKIIRVEVRRRFPVSLEQGYDYITDLGNWPAYWPRLVRIDPRSRWAAVGDRAWLVLRLLGRDVELEMTLGRVERYRLIEYTTVQRGLPDARHERQFAPDGDGFEYRAAVEFSPRAGLTGVADRLLVKRAIGRALRETVANLEARFVGDSGHARA